MTRNLERIGARTITGAAVLTIWAPMYGRRCGRWGRRVVNWSAELEARTIKTPDGKTLRTLLKMLETEGTLQAAG